MPVGSQGFSQPVQTRQSVAWGLQQQPVQSASDIMAQLTRQQWQDYVAQFIPLENDLIDYANNPETVTKAIDKAREGVGAAFAAQPGITERRLRASQQTLTTEEQATADRQANLSKSLADVQAANTARDLTVSRQRGILAGVPTPQVGG